MAGLNLRVGINALQATRELRNLGRTLKGVGNAASKSNKQLKGLQAGVASLTATVGALGGALLSVTGLLAVFGAGAGVASALEFTANFSRNLAEVNTLLTKSGVSIDRYREQLLELSTQSSKTLTDLTQGLYQAISAGIPAIEGAAGAFSVLEAAQRSAVAGLASTEVAVDATVSVMNAYGKEAISVSDINDKLFVAVQQGKTKFDDLAKGLGRVAPIAANTGVSFDDLLTSFVAITRAGVSPAETITGLRNLIRSIAKPTKQTKDQIELLNKSLGESGQTIELSATKLQEAGLTQTLIDLAQATGGNADVLLQIFPNIRAVLPGLILLGKGFSDLTTIQEAFKDSALASAVAFDKIDQELTETIDKLISNIGKISVQVLTNDLGSLNKALLDLNDFLALDETVVRIKSAFVEIKNAVSVLVDVVGAAFRGLAFFTVFKSLGLLANGASLAIGALATRFGFVQATAAASATSTTAASASMSRLVAVVSTLSKTLTTMSAALTKSTMATIALAQAQAKQQLAALRSAAANAQQAAAARAAFIAARSLALASVNVGLASAQAIPNVNRLTVAADRLGAALTRAATASRGAMAAVGSALSAAALPAAVLGAQADVLSNLVVRLRDGAAEVSKLEQTLGRDLGLMLDPQNMEILANSIDTLTFPIIKLGQALNFLGGTLGFGPLFEDLADVGGDTFLGNLGVTGTDIGRERQFKKEQAEQAKAEKAAEKKRLKDAARARKFATDKELKSFDAAVESGARIDVSKLSEGLGAATRDIAVFVDGIGNTLEDKVLEAETKLAALSVFGNLRVKSEEDLEKLKGATAQTINEIKDVAGRVGAKTVGDIVLLAENKERLANFSKSTQDQVKAVAKEVNRLGAAQDKEFAARVRKGVAQARKFFNSVENSEKAALLTGGELAKRIENNIRLNTDLNGVESRAIAVRTTLNVLQEKIVAAEQALAKAKKETNDEDREQLRLQLEGLRGQEEILKLETLDMEVRKQQAQDAKKEADKEKQRRQAAAWRRKEASALSRLEAIRQEALASSRKSEVDLLALGIRKVEIESELLKLELEKNAAKMEELKANHELERSSKNILKITSEAGSLGLGLNPALQKFDKSIEESMKKRQSLLNQQFANELKLLERQARLQEKELSNEEEDRKAQFNKRVAELKKLRLIVSRAKTSPVKNLVKTALKDAQDVFEQQAGLLGEEQEAATKELFQKYDLAGQKLNQEQRKFQLQRRQLLAQELQEITEAIIADQKKRNQAFIKSFKDLERRARVQSNIKFLATAEDVDVDIFLAGFQEKLKEISPEFGVKVKVDTDKQADIQGLVSTIKSLDLDSDNLTDFVEKLNDLQKVEGDKTLKEQEERVKEFSDALKRVRKELETERPGLGEQLEALGSEVIVVTSEVAELTDKLLQNRRQEAELKAETDKLAKGFGGVLKKSVKDLRSEFGKLSFDISKAFTNGLSKAFTALEKFLDKSTSLVSSSAELLTDKLRVRLRSDDFNIFGSVTGGLRDRLEGELAAAQRDLTNVGLERDEFVAKAASFAVPLTEAELQRAASPDFKTEDEAFQKKVNQAVNPSDIAKFKFFDTQAEKLRKKIGELEEDLSVGLFASFTSGVNASGLAVKQLNEEIKKLNNFDGKTINIGGLRPPDLQKLKEQTAEAQKAFDEVNVELARFTSKGKFTDAGKAGLGNEFRFPDNILARGTDSFDPKRFFKFSREELKDQSGEGVVETISALLAKRNEALDRLQNLRADTSSVGERLQRIDSAKARRDELVKQGSGENLTGIEGFKKSAGEFFADALVFAKGQTQFQKENEAALKKFDFKESFKGAASALQEAEGIGLEDLLSRFGPIPEAFGKAADKIAAVFIRFPVDLLSGDLFTENFKENFGGAIADAGIAFGEFFLVALPKAFSLSVDILKEGLLLTFEQFISVLGKTLSPIGQAVAAPVGRLLGSLGSAVGVLADTDAEEDRRDRKDALELQRATLAQLQANGASNESIAQEQARLAALLATKPRETAAERLEAEIERAVTAAKNIAKDLGPLVAQFFSSVTAALPEVIPQLADGLISALQEFAAGFPEFFETLVTQVVDALPAIIDAIIDLLPGLVLALIRAATAIIVRLPDIVTAAIQSIVENIPLIIDALVEALPDLITAIIRAVPQIWGAILKGIPQIIMAIIVGVPQIIIALIRSIPQFIRALGTGLKDLIIGPFEGFAAAIDRFVSAIGDFVKGTGNFLRDVFTFGQGKQDVTTGEGAAKALGQTAAAAGTGALIGGAVAGPVGAAVGAIVGGVGGFVSSIFHEGGNVVSGMRNKGLAAAYRAAGVQGFLNGGMVGDTLRKNFKASMSDDVPALLQTGEAVLNRSAVANVGGPAAIDAINSGAGIAPNLNVNVGINTNGNGLSNAAAALLPFLISSINVTSQSGKAKSSTGQLLGYKGVSAMPSGII